MGWGGESGLIGTSLRDLLPDEVLLRIRTLRFRLRIWNQRSVVEETRDEEQRDPLLKITPFLPPGSWLDAAGDYALGHAKPWAKLLTHVVNVLLAADVDMPGRKMVFELERVNFRDRKPKLESLVVSLDEEMVSWPVAHHVTGSAK